MTTDKSAVCNFYIRYILTLEYLTVLQQSPDLREKKSRQDTLLSNREYRENIATLVLAAKLLMKDESTTLEVVS